MSRDIEAPAYAIVSSPNSHIPQHSYVLTYIITVPFSQYLAHLFGYFSTINNYPLSLLCRLPDANTCSNNYLLRMRSGKSGHPFFSYFSRNFVKAAVMAWYMRRLSGTS